MRRQLTEWEEILFVIPGPICPPNEWLLATKRRSSSNQYEKKTQFKNGQKTWSDSS